VAEFFLLPQAHCDLEAIEARLARDDLKVARRIMVAMVETFELLAQFPRLGRARPELRAGVRSFPLEGYVILYHLVRGEVEILRVIRGERDLGDIARDLPPAPGGAF
jgi:toxin ParE1/3/4